MHSSYGFFLVLRPKATAKKRGDHVHTLPAATRILGPAIPLDYASAALSDDNNSQLCSLEASRVP